MFLTTKGTKVSTKDTRGNWNVVILLMFVLILPQVSSAQVRCGSDRTGLYFPLLKNKDIAVVANPASVIGTVNLVDSLVRSGINVVKIFCPEHGFREFAEAGKTIKDMTDPVTGISIASLYGKKKKPDAEDLEDVDLVLFDLQDVGVRFFTYLSTLHYVMESCAGNRVPMMLLDRPNPNGFYTDGPVMEPEFSSFVGLHPIPIVYGMTIGEYAQMINGEGWLRNGMICELHVIPLENYSHSVKYNLRRPPSPNLRTMNAILLYPSICLFEGTRVSVGRGTLFPFEVFGHPEMKDMGFTFIPTASGGSDNIPLYNGKVCNGVDLREISKSDTMIFGKINLSWLEMAFHNLGSDPKFFNDYFDKLAGNSTLRQQIIRGASETEIRESWSEKLGQFREVRKKYLLYPD
jgi:uncharacterized protein YbbC (DUF1343 family)